MSKTDDGGADVAALEARIDALEEQYSDETVSDSDGNRISLGGLLNSGLSRRQALKTMALVVSGATLTGAMTQSVAAQNAITGIDQLGEQGDRIGTIYAEDIDTDTFTQSTDAISADSISTGELNNVHVVPEDTTDIGQTLNDIEAEVAEGAVIYVPPGDYDLSTTWAPSKRLVVYGDHSATNYNTQTGPTITRQSDVPLIDTDDNIGVAVTGIRFESAVSGTTTAIQVRGSCWFDQWTAANFDSDVFYLESNADSNCNSSRIVGANLHYIGGDGITVDNTGGTIDVNALNIEVENATSVDGYPVNMQSGWGSQVTVNHAESIGDGSGTVVYAGTNSTIYRVTYVEGAGTIFEFDGVYNTCEFCYTSGVSTIDTGVGENHVYNRGDPSNGSVIKSTSSRLDFTDSPMGVNDLRLTDNAHRIYGTGGVDDLHIVDNDENETIVRQRSANSTLETGETYEYETVGAGLGFIVSTPDGSARYRIRVDDSGSLTTDQL